MPPITRLYVKTALVYLVAALLVGVATTLRSLTMAAPLVGALSPVYFHLFMVGWVTQLIFGVAYWMFPKFTKALPRGRDWLALSAYWLINLGLIVRAVAEPIQVVQPLPIWGMLIVIAAILQWLGGLAFVVNTWPRVKEK